MIEDLDIKLNPKKESSPKLNPESQLEDKSVPYSKIQLKGRITNDDIKDGAGIPISKTELLTYVPWTNYTPYVLGTPAGTTTYGTRFGRYMQVGKLCYFLFYVVVTGNSVGSGDIRCLLPITATANGGICTVGTSGLNLDAGVVSLYGAITANEYHFRIAEVLDDGTLIHANMVNESFSITAGGFYEVA